MRSFLRSALEITASGFDLAALVNTDPAKVKLTAFEDRLRERLEGQILGSYGVTLRQVGIESLTLPAEALTATVARMRAERQTVATERVAEGERIAAEIRAAADRDARVTVARAHEEAAATEAKARVAAAAIAGRAYAEDPGLYVMLRSFDTLDAVVGQNTRLILRTDAVPFRVLVDGPSGTKAGQRPRNKPPRDKLPQANGGATALITPIAGAWEQAIRLAFRFLFAAIGVLALAWAVSNVRVVPPDARAAVLRLGAVMRIEGPGLLLAWPQPIEQVVLLPGPDRQIAQTVHRFDSTPVALTGQPPEFQVSPDARSNAAFLLTGETGIVHLQATLVYRIDDPHAYLLAASRVPAALDRIFGASAVAVCASRGLDAILVARPGPGRCRSGQCQPGDHSAPIWCARRTDGSTC